MKSLASQHDKAAKEAYHKNDHQLAMQYARIAKDEHRIAGELHRQAAAKIFEITNRKNNIWRIDLHGLHGEEATYFLQERLNEIKTEAKPLEVITGVGKHSNGKPVLPIKVPNFLSDNKYQFKEIRPGVLKVWPIYNHINVKIDIHQAELNIMKVFKRKEEKVAVAIMVT
ncbi:Smr (small MutS-related) domain protein [Medicago truncatula]|uniref:Smr (Small MutS-related) domain protein n=1 Tax=Medicago truncatula TaxID=3880 RepID=A0A072U7U7_MEDTR|nr:Smr (small MutS-related) domain protein [Medicago truncatula]